MNQDQYNKKIVPRMGRFLKAKDKLIKKTRQSQVKDRVKSATDSLSGLKKGMDYPIKSNALKRKMK